MNLYYESGYGFGGFFGIMQILFPIFFLLVLVILVVSVARGIGEWRQNNASPVLTVDAKLVAKRTEATTTHHGDGGDPHQAQHLTTTTSYYATFQVESGDRIEFRVSGREYGILAEGDVGRLTFQGTRYREFSRQ